MSIEELAIKLMRRAEEAVELSKKLHAEVFAHPARKPERWDVLMGDPADGWVVGRFDYEGDAFRFAEDVNRVLRPIAQQRCLTILSTCMNEMADGLHGVSE